MRKLALALLAAAALAAWGSTPTAKAYEPFTHADIYALRHARTFSWHRNFYYTDWGHPTALMVPPIATTSTSLSWGVAQSEVRPLYHQFRRPYPGPVVGGGGTQFLPTPRWPSHTDQFGIYYVRGPW